MNSLYQISAPLCLLLAATFLSSRVSPQTPVRVGRPLLIALNFHSPSMAAFSDSQMRWTQGDKGRQGPESGHLFSTEGGGEALQGRQKLVKTVELRAGHSRFSQNIFKGKKRVKEPMLPSHEKLKRKLNGLNISLNQKTASPSVVSLNGMIIDKAKILKKSSGRVLALKGMVIDQAKVLKENSSSLLAVNGVETDTKPLKIRSSQVLLVKSSSQSSGHPKPSRKTQNAKDRVSRKQVYTSTLGHPIYIQSQLQELPELPELPVLNLEKNKSENLSLNKKITQGQPFANDSIVAKYTPPKRDAALYELSGSLEIIGGLIFTGEDTQLSISRVVHDQVMDRGDFIIQDSIYKIFVSDLKGHIVVRLYDVEGKILGLGEFDLYQLPDRAKELDQIDKLHITVKPHNSALIAKVVSGESFGDHFIPAPKSRLMISSVQGIMISKGATTLSDERFLSNASFVVNAEREGHWGSLAVGVHNGRDQLIRIYPESMVRAFLRIHGVSEVNGSSRPPIIWGRVTKKGQSVRGVQVELAGGEVPPVYFNAYIPDSQLKATETDGLFAFVGVSSGMQSVRATTLDGKYISTHVIPTQENHVSYLEIESGTRRSASIAVYDGRTHEPLSASVSIYGTERELHIDGLQEEAIHFPGGPGVMMMEVEVPGKDYLYSRYSVARSQTSINLPVVRADWLEDMEKHFQIKQSSDLGVIVGYLDDWRDKGETGHKTRSESVFEYRASLDIVDPDVEYDRSHIVYFNGKHLNQRRVYQNDSDKRAQRGVNRRGYVGKNGGGFILFNVPMGMHTVTVSPLEGSSFFTQVAIVGNDAINVIPVDLY